MNKKKSAWIRLIVSSITTLALISVLIVGIYGGNIFSFHWGIGFSSHYADADKYQAGNGSISAGTLKELDINWISGQVTVLPYSGDTIEITETSPESLTEETMVHHYYNDGTLYIQYQASIGFSFFHRSPSEKKLEIKIPEALAAQLEQVSGDGVSADMSFTGLTTRNLSLDTVSGHLTFDGSVQNIDSDSVSGDCECISRLSPESVNMDSVSGDQHLQIPEDTSFEADYDTVSGGFTCDFATTNRGDSVICGTGDNEYNFDTVSGDIFLSPVSPE
ncbi:MAG: DUF4097 family beta strand repeat protein [Lachnospiraceae bacterium]|nr:DUF4097 family beta strand repeat protein [Lachnospiraceae bacterium]